jgi:hypothetical protein
MELYNFKVSKNKNRADSLNVLLKKIFLPKAAVDVYTFVSSGCSSLGG